MQTLRSLVSHELMDGLGFELGEGARGRAGRTKQTDCSHLGFVVNIPVATVPR